MSYSLDADALVRNCPSANFSGAWPLPVQARIEDMVRRATDAGERTSTRELLAAIVCAFEAEDDGWHILLRRYRQSKVRELLPAVVADENVVLLERRRPGRPPALSN